MLNFQSKLVPYTVVTVMFVSLISIGNVSESHQNLVLCNLIRMVRVSEKIWYETSRELSSNFRCKRGNDTGDLCTNLSLDRVEILHSSTCLILNLGISPPLCHCASVLVETKPLICLDENQPIMTLDESC